jgi:hypothetical protein
VKKTDSNNDILVVASEKEKEKSQLTVWFEAKTDLEKVCPFGREGTKAAYS